MSADQCRSYVLDDDVAVRVRGGRPLEDDELELLGQIVNAAIAKVEFDRAALIAERGRCDSGYDGAIGQCRRENGHAGRHMFETASL